MTKKDYEAIAAAIQSEVRYHPHGYAYIQPRELIDRLSAYFQRDNARFDPGRFLHACEPTRTMDDYFTQER